MSQKKAETEKPAKEQPTAPQAAHADQAVARREAFKKNLLAMLEGKPLRTLKLEDGEHQFAILRDGVFHCTATNDKQETFIVDSVGFAFLLDIKDLTVHVELAWTSPFGMQYSKILPHAALYSDAAFANTMGFLFNHGLAMMLPQLNKFRLDLCGIQPFGLTKLVKVVAKDQEPDAPADQAAQA